MAAAALTVSVMLDYNGSQTGHLFLLYNVWSVHLYKAVFIKMLTLSPYEDTFFIGLLDYGKKYRVLRLLWSQNLNFKID